LLHKKGRKFYKHKILFYEYKIVVWFGGFLEMAGKIKVAIAGIGNCASSLIQGVEYYKDVTAEDELVPGLMHNVFGGYRVSDVDFVAAFDVDKRKVGKPLNEAVFEKPNNTIVFQEKLPKWGNVIVQKGPVLDGVAEHMSEYPEEQSFRVDEKQKPVDVTNTARRILFSTARLKRNTKCDPRSTCGQHAGVHSAAGPPSTFTFRNITGSMRIGSKIGPRRYFFKSISRDVSLSNSTLTLNS